MANGKIRFGKQSGGQLAFVIPDGVANTDIGSFSYDRINTK